MKITVIAIFVILIDQLSKSVAVRSGFEVSYNQGISLGLFSELSPSIVIALLILVFVVLFVFLKDFLKKENPVYLGMFLGGALSNFVDRLFFLSVRDWLPLPFLGLKNNLADWAIFLGLVMIVFSEFERKAQKKI